MSYFTCECCELTYTEAGDGHRCAGCREHFYIRGEDNVRVHARLTHHAEVTRARYLEVRDIANQMEERMRSALRSRDRWKFAMVKLVEQHNPAGGRCSCGKQDPCPTIRALREQAPRGIADDVEQLLTMVPSRLQYEMFGRYAAEPWERQESLAAALAEEAAVHPTKAT